MTAPERVAGVLVTHGRLGAELVRTAESILGPQTDLTVATNAGKSLEALQAEIESLAAAGRPVVVFVDLLGGSCGHVCALVGRARPEMLLVGGVNLPMLLEFLCHRDRAGREELRERLLSRAHAGIRAVGWGEEPPA